MARNQRVSSLAECGCLINSFFWLGYRGWHASKQLPKLGAAAALLIDEEPAPGPLDPRVTN